MVMWQSNSNLESLCRFFQSFQLYEDVSSGVHTESLKVCFLLCFLFAM